MSDPRSSVVPDLIDALTAALAPLLVDVTVCDGVPADSNSGDYFAVGVDDFDGITPVASARSDIDWAGAHRAVGLNEVGELACAAWAWRGEGDAKAARDACYSALSILQALLRADPSVGVSGLWSSWIAGTQLTQAQAPDGATALLVIRVGFKARL